MKIAATLLGTVALAGLAALSGCVAPGYYLQAAGGQLTVWRLSRPIGEVRADERTDATVREKLARIEALREFASHALSLPDNGSYRKYADVRRPYVVWNVFATSEFSVRPEQWCFPVAGCVGYRGYFDDAAARTFADELRALGRDVHVTGVPAYSTLGWFDDPVLNTFIHYPETEIARLIFHELAHQVAWAGDDTEFNESFAVAVETEGIERWLAARASAAQRAGFEQAQRRRAQFVALVLKYREALDRLYRSGADDAQKRRGKAQRLAELRREYRALRDGAWRGFAGYDRWFGQEINNATLASVGIYTRLVPAFRELLVRNGGDLPAFYAQVRRLAALPREQRRIALERQSLRPAAPETAAAGPQS